MQISKFSLWICALALGGVVTIHAQDTPAQAAARVALQQKMSELDVHPAAPAAVPAAVTPAPAVAALADPVPAPTMKPVAMKPIVAPALPITLSKAEKLHALLANYKADQITPEQYHIQRAAILAAP